MAEHFQGQGQTMQRLEAPVDDEKQDEKPETILLGPFELVKEKVMAVPGLLRLLAVGLLLIMFICAIAGGGPGAFKFLIFCWVLFTPATAYLSLKDWHPDGPPEMLSPVLEFSLVRLAVFAVAFVFTFFGALVAWSKNEGSGAQQAAGAFGALAGVAMGANAFFAFRQRREEIEKLAADKADEDPEKKKEAESSAAPVASGGGGGGGGGDSAPPVDRNTKPVTVSDTVGGGGGGMGYRVRDLNDLPSMEPPVPERGAFNTLASRNNTMNLQQGERIGYRGHTQYNETYEDEGPSVMDNPQPLTHMTYKPNELELNVAGLDDGYNEYGERNLGTLPRDRTLGYGVPEQPAAYMSGPTDNNFNG